MNCFEIKELCHYFLGMFNETKPTDVFTLVQLGKTNKIFRSLVNNKLKHLKKFYQNKDNFKLLGHKEAYKSCNIQIIKYIDNLYSYYDYSTNYAVDHDNFMIIISDNIEKLKLYNFYDLDILFWTKIAILFNCKTSYEYLSELMYINNIMDLSNEYIINKKWNIHQDITIITQNNHRLLLDSLKYNYNSFNKIIDIYKNNNISYDFLLDIFYNFDIDIYRNHNFKKISNLFNLSEEYLIIMIIIKHKSLINQNIKLLNLILSFNLVKKFNYIDIDFIFNSYANTKYEYISCVKYLKFCIKIKPILVNKINIETLENSNHINTVYISKFLSSFSDIFKSIYLNKLEKLKKNGLYSFILMETINN